MPVRRFAASAALFALCLLGTLGGLGGAGLGCAPTTPAPDPTEVLPGDATLPQAVRRGMALYDLYCVMCHAPEGAGYAADNANQLAHPDFLAMVDDAFLRESIVHGRPGTPMSAWARDKGGRLTSREVDDVVALMRHWQTAPSVTPPAVAQGDAAAGAGIFAARCAGCHGDDAQGGEYMSVANPRFLEIASDAFIAESIRKGRTGTPMPAFGMEHATDGALSETDIADVTAFIRSLQTEPPEAPLPPPPDLSDPVIHPDGMPAAFEKREGRFVAADDIAAALEDGQAMVILDARPASDYVLDHISGALSVPYYAVSELADVLPRDVPILTYCGCPHALSGRAVDALLALGFTDVAVIDEGFYVWRDRGYPVTVGTERGQP